LLNRRGLDVLFRAVQPAFLFVLAVLPLAAADHASSDLIQRAQELRLAQSPQWLALLHVRPNLWRRMQSEIDDARFFLSPNGRRHPDQELNATLRQLADPDVQCRFPARYSWLKEQLQFTSQEVPQAACPRFDAWRTQMNADSVSLIFAAAYLNNPASMYGHTFLRLNRPASDRTSSNHLLDYTVNFAADADTSNGILFAFYGLTGGFRGKFSTLPYYGKVQEYTNLESRDLWEYRLTLTPAQMKRLVEHLWEMGQASMAYFFFNKNCSYQLLPLLEAANPEWDLARHFILRAIPVDTTRVVLALPEVSAAVRRPSFRAEMLGRRARLSHAEIHLAEKLVQQPLAERPADLQSLSPERQSLILESAHDYWRVRHGFRRGQSAAVQEKEHQLLTWRSRATVSSGAIVSVTLPREVPPDRGHRTLRLSVGHAFSSRGSFQEIAIRPAMHDLDDRSEGFPPGSQLEFFHPKLRWDDKREKLFLEEFRLVSVYSLVGWDRWMRKPSWTVSTGMRTAHDLPRDPDHALYYGLTTGPGFSRELGWRSSRVYALLELDAGWGNTFEKNGRIGGGPAGGVTLDVMPSLRLRAEARYAHYAWGAEDSRVQLQVIPSWSITDRLDLRATLKRDNRYKEALISILLFL